MTNIHQGKKYSSPNTYPILARLLNWIWSICAIYKFGLQFLCLLDL